MIKVNEESSQRHVQAQARYRQNHPDRIRAQRKEYYLKNADKIRAYSRRMNRKEYHKNYMKNYMPNYYKTHRMYFLKRSREVRVALRREILNLFGNKCAKCGFTDIRALQIDHVNGDGPEQRRQFKSALGGSEKWLKFVLNEIKIGSTHYQLLCANCNWIKKYECKENTRKYFFDDGKT